MNEQLIRSVLSSEAERLFGTSQSIDAWIADTTTQGRKVKLFREYRDGNHRANLTIEMRNLLRITDSGSLNEFNDNYMDIIVQTMVDRLTVTRIEADNDAASEWVTTLLADNRFDGMQTDVTQGAVGDGRTFGHAYWDNDQQRVILSHEPAYDGTNGVIVYYSNPANPTPDVALKIWVVGSTTYVTVYYPERIEKFISFNGSNLSRREVPGEPWPAPWTMPGGAPLGVPFIDFRNRGVNWSDQGHSEIENAIPLQDALNRTLYSMVMTAELTGFPIRWAKGFQPPAALTPGGWITMDPHEPRPATEGVVDLGVMEQGQIAPFLQQAQWLTSEIGKITRTPAPEFSAGDNASGESLKQREIGLIGKCKRFQVKAGNAWEDFIALAWRVQSAFSKGKQPPAYTRLYCRWADVEIRNDEKTVQNALAVADRIGERETLRQLAPVFGWDEKQITNILAEKREDETRKLGTLAGNLPGFSGATFGISRDNGLGIANAMSKE